MLNYYGKEAVRMTIRKIITVLSAAALLFTAGCSFSDYKNNKDTESIPSCTKELFAMDTYMTVTAYGENSEKAVSEALTEIQRLDSLLSTGKKDSEISILNKTGKANLSEDSRYLMDKADYIFSSTGGAFDITVYPLMTLWGFQGGEPSLPEDKQIKEVLTLIGQDRIKYNDSEIILGNGQGIDFGGIAKGYTGNRIMKIFEKNDIVSGVISLGGNVQCYGKKTDGSLWRCGITDPDNPEDKSSLIGTVEVSDKAVVTSGGYERFFKDENSGVTYHHIMDPSTGYSADNGLLSVTIVSSDGTLADGLSTACFVMGEDKAIEFWRQHSSEFDMILINDKREITVTQGISQNFTSDRIWNVES